MREDVILCLMRNCPFGLCAASITAMMLAGITGRVSIHIPVESIEAMIYNKKPDYKNRLYFRAELERAIAEMLYGSQEPLSQEKGISPSQYRRENVMRKDSSHIDKLRYTSQ
jgi:hypothetical protein